MNVQNTKETIFKITVPFTEVLFLLLSV